jgi:hypothetical protein
MKSKTRQILIILHILSWILFIGLCVQAGAILYSSFVSLAINPEGAKNLHLGLNLSSLYSYDKGHYIALVAFFIVLSALKAYIFYVIIKIFLKINLVHPFNKEVGSLIVKIGNTALSIGIVGVAGNAYSEWLIRKGVELPELHRYLGGTGEFLFLAAVVFFIAQIFKRGIELQTENELTV